jgi:hypothetical protein
MPGINDRINAVLGTIQNLFTVLRDVFLAVLLIVLLGFPSQLNSILSKAGITQVNGGVFTWQQAQQAAQQGTAAAQANSSASDTLDDVKTTLEQIASQSTDPAIQKLATDAANQAGGSITSLDTANNSLAQSVLTLQAAAPGTSSVKQTSPTAGWVLLGNADPTHQQWTKSTTPKIATSSPNVTAGQTITFTGNVFLRGDNAQTQTHDQAPILGAVRSGSTAQVTAVDYVANRKGNVHVWVKVTMKSNS